jgi:hypothetical protein
MPICDNPLIEEALSAIQLSPHAPRGEVKGTQLPLRPASDEVGKVTQDALWLHYSTDTKVSFQRLLKDIEKGLSDSEHPKPDEFSLFVLALARLIPAHRGSALARLNAVLASVCDDGARAFRVFDLNGFQTIRGNRRIILGEIKPSGRAGGNLIGIAS